MPLCRAWRALGYLVNAPGGGDSVPLPNGDLPNTREIVRALDLENFALSPVTAAGFVPVQVQEK